MNWTIPFFIIGADAVLDLRKREIFPLLTLTGVLTGILCSLAAQRNTPVELILSMSPGAVVLAGAMLTKGEIGAGDALVLFAIGAWTDLWTVWGIALSGALFAAVFSMVLWVIRRKNEEIPFVPFLLAGMILFRFL